MNINDIIYNKVYKPSIYRIIRPLYCIGSYPPENMNNVLDLESGPQTPLYIYIYIYI